TDFFIFNVKAKMHLNSLVLPTLCLMGVAIDCFTANIAPNNILCADSGAGPCIDDVDDGVPTETETETETETVGSSYLGCFSDLPDARIFTFGASTAAMTADACLMLCADSAYYGTQYSEECWCGAKGADYDANGEGVCDMPCGGDADEICGGFWAMSVYENDDDDGEIDDPSYLGCYSNPAESRVFVQDIPSAAMTAELRQDSGIASLKLLAELKGWDLVEKLHSIGVTNPGELARLLEEEDPFQIAVDSPDRFQCPASEADRFSLPDIRDHVREKDFK
ncbi:unnamed protein product, partial [Ectocarpus sp. 12 AP-2014]